METKVMDRTIAKFSFLIGYKPHLLRLGEDEPRVSILLSEVKTAVLMGHSIGVFFNDGTTKNVLYGEAANALKEFQFLEMSLGYLREKK